MNSQSAPKSRQDLISVIMPCNNAEMFLSFALTSALSQTYRNVEVVAVNDGSTDNTISILEERSRQDSRLRYCHQSRRGAGAARNRGLREANGKFVAFLDSDDYWDESCLERLHRGLVTSNAAIAYSGWQNVGLDGGRGKPFVPPDYTNVDRIELLLGGNRWPIHAALCRKDIIDGENGFDQRWSSCEDYDLWLRVATTHPIVRVPAVLAYYRHHQEERITRNRVGTAKNFLSIQRAFLARNPGISKRLGFRKIRKLTYGEMLRRAYLCYWERDLDAARTLFREVMRHGYGSVNDWKYMLPSLLPGRIHRYLILAFNKSDRNVGNF